MYHRKQTKKGKFEKAVLEEVPDQFLRYMEMPDNAKGKKKFIPPEKEACRSKKNMRNQRA